MGKPQNTNTIPDDKMRFYRDKLFREVSNLFKWENMPQEIPLDYLESTLVRLGQAAFLYDEAGFGYMALQCSTSGFNIYNQPTQATVNLPSSDGKPANYSRTIVHSYVPVMDAKQGCVLISNMYGAQPLSAIVDYHARRLALIAMAFDTNALWQNIPVIIPVPDADTKLSIDTMFWDIMSGKPWVIVDRAMMAGEKPIQAGAAPVPFLLDKLKDALHEEYSDFKAAVGIDTAGVEKAERVNYGELNSNRQATETCLEIMLFQRKKAATEINRLFGLGVSVSYVGEQTMEEGEKNGQTDNGAEGLPRATE